ncbi:type II secretion system F family protein [Rosenbergiella epipactidis]|uniref:type II secretion system F family protein n=1 Tax=Rosenbergiella epipactidis TaxID=1544694 RepID=UPI002026E0E5|nr:type II secretion system F family protein [Rosenbergiella epipactidis]MCL9667360.1 type II secretion system F family protein [Rosenbergiella epipactidis]
MKNIYIIFIIISFLFALMVWLRVKKTRHIFQKNSDRKNVLMMLVGKDFSVSTKESLKDIIIKNIRNKLAGVRYVFVADSPFEFIKRVLVPIGFVLIVQIININYFNFPSLPIILVLTPFSYIVWYKILLKKRKKVFEVDFTESISSINGAISSGRTFLQAMDDYSKNNNNHLAKEFGVITRRLNFGDNPEVVFFDSWKVYPYKEYYFFIVAILLNINSGGRLREVLGKLQRSLASNTAMEKKMLTLTSEMRMASKITGAIPFLFLILLKFISEENFNFIFEDPRGNMLLYYLLGSVATGILIIKFLMRKI